MALKLNRQHLFFRHPRLQVLVKRPNFAAVCFAVEKRINDTPKNGC